MAGYVRTGGRRNAGVRDLRQQLRQLLQRHQRRLRCHRRPAGVVSGGNRDTPGTTTVMKTAENSSPTQDQLLSIRQDATGLMSGLSDAQFNWQPEPGRWSMAGCFDHLNLSAAQLFMPSIDAAIAHARARRGSRATDRSSTRRSNAGACGRTTRRRACVSRRRNAFSRCRASRSTRFVPSFSAGRTSSANACVEADGLDLQRAKHKSPIPLVKWSLGAYFQLMLAHERRHVWQARMVRQNPAFPA